MSIQPPSATEFLNMPSDPDDESAEEETETRGVEFTFNQPDLIWQIAAPHELLAPLERIANALEGQGSDAAEEDRVRESLQTLNENFDDLEAKYESLFGLLADVEKLVSKSTSKLANGVRDAITAWKTGVPEVPSEVVAELTPEVAAVVEEVAAANDADVEPADGHNHGWARTVDGVLVCECGAWIDERDAAYPQGVVREPNDG